MMLGWDGWGGCCAAVEMEIHEMSCNGPRRGGVVRQCSVLTKTQLAKQRCVPSPQDCLTAKAASARTPASPSLSNTCSGCTFPKTSWRLKMVEDDAT